MDYCNAEFRQWTKKQDVESKFALPAYDVKNELLAKIWPEKAYGRNARKRFLALLGRERER